MHTAPGDLQTARTINLFGALALEAVTAQEQAATAAVGQAGAAAGALVTIGAHPNKTLEELRIPLGLSQPGTTRLIDRLVGAGWVERSGVGGRHGLQLRLTPAGWEVVERIFAARRAALAELLAPLSAADRKRLETMLERLLAARTHDGWDARRMCRVCERPVCSRCPVAHAVP
jgi:MarR family transcriptional regulator, negative regulator of the multidrug operon emrRAB